MSGPRGLFANILSLIVGSVYYLLTKGQPLRWWTFGPIIIFVIVVSVWAAIRDTDHGWHLWRKTAGSRREDA